MSYWCLEILSDFFKVMKRVEKLGLELWVFEVLEGSEECYKILR